MPLTIDRLGRQLQMGASLIPLSGLEFALYYFVARKRQQAACMSNCPGCMTCTVGTADFLNQEVIDALERIAAEIGLRDPRLQELRWRRRHLATWATDAQTFPEIR